MIDRPGQYEEATRWRLRFRRSASLVIGASIAFWTQALAAAPPKVDYLNPAGGQAGQEVAVTASGSFSAWPVKAWTSRDDVTVECQKDKGKLLVKIANDAAPGVTWLRLYNDEGASAVRPFVIGTLPEVAEKEPNDDWRKPQLLSEPSVVVNGQLPRSGEVDVFALDLEKGQTLVAAIEANQVLGSPMDAVLQVVSPDGFVLAQSDDDRGLDPLLAVTAPAQGTYRVRVFAFPAVPTSSVNFAGDASYIYRLTLTRGGFLDAALPMALVAGKPNRVQLVGWNLPAEAALLEISPPEGAARHQVWHPLVTGALSLPVVSQPVVIASPDEPQQVELPALLCGQLLVERGAHTYVFSARKGQRLAFASEARSLGYAIDPVLLITDASGKELARNDDKSREDRDARLEFTAAADGEYRLVVKDLHGHAGPRFVYRVSAGPSVPDFALKLTADAFTLAAGKTVEISVNVERTGNLKDEIEILAVDLPEGVTAESVKSAGSGNSAKSVKLKLAAAEGTSFQGPIRIVGRTSGEGGREQIATAPLAAFNAAVEDVWLTVTK